MDARRVGTRYCMLLMVLLMALLAGCAAERLQRDGLELIQAGRVEEGLGKLGESSALEPGNAGYRALLLRTQSRVVQTLLERAARERLAQRPETARQLYDQVLRIAPGDRSALAGTVQLEVDRRHGAWLELTLQALKKGDMDAAEAPLKRILLENPNHERAVALQRQIDERVANVEASGSALSGKFKKPVTLLFREAALKVVFEALARTSGINVVLDKDVKADTKISLYVSDVSVADAIDLVIMQSQLEKKVIGDNTVFIYQNSAAKLKEYQDLKIRSFHLVNADAKQILAMIKTVLKTRDIFVHEKTNSIIMRDTPEAIALASRLVDDQDLADPEVMLEVEVLEISGSRLSELGLAFPSSASFSLQGVAGAGLNVDAFRHINGGNILVSPVPAVTLNLLLQDGGSNLLASPRIRARNREKAKIMIGDRVPVITNAVTPVSTGTPVVTGNVQYLDVGLKLEVEPEIHRDNEVSIKINLEVSSIVKEVQNTVSGTLAYQVGTRNATTVLRLKDGETQILGGLISDEDRNGASKIPGLGQLPLLGHLFSSHRGDRRKTEIVLSITPRIIGNNRVPDGRKTEYWAGTEGTPRSVPLMARHLGLVAVAGTDRAAPAGRAPRATAASPNPGVVASPANQPVNLAWQGPNQAKVGESITVTLNTQSTQAIKTLAMNIVFDPAVLRPIDIVEGNFGTQAGGQSVLAKDINAAAGDITLLLTSPNAAGASGAGSLATIVFEVIARTSTQTELKAVQIAAVGAMGEAVAANPLAPLAISVSQ